MSVYLFADYLPQGTLKLAKGGYYVDEDVFWAS